MQAQSSDFNIGTYYEERHKIDEALGCMVSVAVSLLAAFTIVRLIDILIGA